MWFALMEIIYVKIELSDIEYFTNTTKRSWHLKHIYKCVNMVERVHLDSILWIDLNDCLQHIVFSEDG